MGDDKEQPSRKPKRAKQSIVVALALALLASSLVAGAVFWTGSTHHSQPNGGAAPDTIVINSGSTQAACVDVTTCGLTSLSVALNSVVLVGISSFSSTAPSAVAVVGGVSGTCTSASLSSGGSSTDGESRVYGCVDKTAALAAGHVYVNFSSAAYYDIYFIDLENTLVTTSYYTAGTGTDGATTTATCATTATSQPTEIFEQAGWKTTAESTISADTTGFTAMTKQATTTSVETANAEYGPDTVTTAFTATLLGSSSADWSSACVAVYPAAAPGVPTALTLGTTTTTTMPVTWSLPASSEGIIGAEVWEAAWSGSCGAYSQNVAASSPYTSATATGTSGNYYCLEVDAENSTGWGANGTALTDVGPSATPNAPTLLVATPQGGTTTQVSLSWTLPTGQTLVNQTIDGFTGASCGTYSSAVTENIADPTTTSTIISSLTSGTSYSFNVRDWSSVGEGAASSCAAATTFGTPSAPTGLAASSVTGYTVPLSWTNPSGTLYNDTIVYGASCGSSTYASWSHSISVGVAGTYTVAGLNPYTSYCFAVAAWSGGASSAFSSTLVVQTPAGTPGQPMYFQLTAITGTTASFSWTNPSAASGTLTNDTAFYGASCGTDTTGPTGNPGTWSNAISLNAVVTSYTFTGLTVSTSYCFSVSAWTQGGQGVNATALTETTQGNAPSAPTFLTYDSASHVAVTLNWTQPSGTITNDTVYYTTTGSCAGTLTAVSTGVSKSATVNGLTASTTYYWEVTAWSGGGQSAKSSCVTGATEGATPNPPYEVTGASITTTTVYLTWTNPAGYELTDNKVYVSNANGACGTWSQSNDLAGVYTDYEVTGLTPASTYCIEVTAVDAESNFSASYTFSTADPGGGGGGGGGGASDVTGIIAIFAFILVVAMLAAVARSLKDRR